MERKEGERKEKKRAERGELFVCLSVCLLLLLFLERQIRRDDFE